MERFDFNYFKGFWNWVHFFGGITGVFFIVMVIRTLTLYSITRSVLIAAIATFLIDVCKEILDEITANIEFLSGRFGFDPAGFDLRDVIFCSFGILGMVFYVLINDIPGLF